MTPPRPSRALLIALACVGCVQDLELGQLGIAVGEPPDAAASVCEPVNCMGQPNACADCVDNDGDGLQDYEDPDCWGPCDDSEELFAGGKLQCPSDVCFFQADCGSGNDEACLALVPNGCDCYGCCLVQGRSAPIYLGSVDADGNATCGTNNLEDPQACQSCTLDETCFNPCDDCELCFAQSSVAQGCGGDAGCTPPQCDDGVQPCGSCAGSCDGDTVCISGCCVTPG